MLALIDLSAAFDSVDHRIVLRRLGISYGLDGVVLQWFVSYLDHRTQFVRCRDSKSTPAMVDFGVPHESVLGPLLFLLYTAYLKTVIQSYDPQQIRRLLGRDVTAKLVSAFVISRLDYGNAVLAGLPQSTIAPLQRVQNAAACLVLGLRPRDHVTAALIDLHWLPAAARIEYKLCTLVYQSVTGNAPEYITDMLQPVSDLDRSTQLRSASKGERAFRVAAPRLWNELPPDIRKSSTLATFKKHLKTYLFCKHYGLVLEQ